jgi:hypothetical protein
MHKLRTIKTGAAAMAVVGFVDYKSQFYKVSHDYLLLKARILCLFLSGTVERVVWCEKYLRLAHLRVPYSEGCALHLVLSGLALGCVDLKSRCIELGCWQDMTVPDFTNY